MAALSDEELIQQFSSTKDMAFFGELYQRYNHLVYGVCLKYIKNKEECRDITMNIFEDLIHKIPKQKEIRSFNFWIYSVAKNECISFLRKTKKNPTSALDENFLENNHDFYMENEVILTLYNKEGSKSKEETVQEAVNQLSTAQKECIKAFYLEKQSYKQIADKLNLPLVKVKSHIQNGKRNLKTILLDLKSRV